MIHLRAIFDNNGSRRNLSRIRKYEAAEKELKLTQKLIEELSEDKRPKYWWAN